MIWLRRISCSLWYGIYPKKWHEYAILHEHISMLYWKIRDILNTDILNFSMNYDEYHMRDIHDNDINNSILAISMELVWEEFAEINCPSLISATHQYVRLQVGDHIWRVEGRLHDCCQPADRVCTTPLWTSHRKTPLHLVQIPGELTYHRPTSV